MTDKLRAHPAPDEWKCPPKPFFHRMFLKYVLLVKLLYFVLMTYSFLIHSATSITSSIFRNNWGKFA